MSDSARVSLVTRMVPGECQRRAAVGTGRAVKEPDSLPLPAVLADLGYRSDEAQELARACLVQAKLTTARKQRISVEKLERVKQCLAASFVLCCRERTCRTVADATGRQVIAVTLPSDCERCGGSLNRAAAASALEVLGGAGVRRIVVVGGSPSTREEILNLFCPSVELRLVCGTERRTARDARADLTWADLVVIWGATELSHAVSRLYTETRDPRVVTCTRRGVVALAETLSRAVLEARRRRGVVGSQTAA